MKCETEDSANRIICVATIKQIKGPKLHIHFDGWPKKWDFWTPITSQKVHHVGWCADVGIPLCPPKGMFQTTVKCLYTESPICSMLNLPNHLDICDSMSVTIGSLAQS